MAAAKKSPVANSAPAATGKLSAAAAGKSPAAAANSPVAPGAFITVEGADGAGKTTHLDFIERHLRSHGHAVTRSREPGGTALGERLRGLLLGGPDTDAAISDRAELLLVFAARAQHLDEVIAPALAAGRWVLCDRFTDATYAYQGGGRGLDARAIAVLEDWTHRGLQPDLTLLLDVPVEVGQARTRRREQAEQGGGADGADGVDGADRFERESTEFKQAVRAAYLARAAQFPARIKRIDAAVGIAQVRAELQTVLDAFDRARQTSQNA